MKKIFVIGGARSGKSAYAETLAVSMQRPKLYVATAAGDDEEMAARIAKHAVRRDESWQTLEERLEVTAILRDSRWQGHVILVDCLTLWLSNIMAEGAQDVERRRWELCDAVRGSEAHIIMVTNEVGCGITPVNALARKFIDEAGLLHQAVARVCDTVVLVTAGLPMMLKTA